MSAQARNVVAARRTRQLLEHGAARVEGLELVLGKEADLHVVARLAAPAVKGQNTGQDPEQGGLARAVWTHEREPISPPQLQACALVHLR